MAKSSLPAQIVLIAILVLFVAVADSQNPNVTVSHDKTGNFSSIRAAIQAAPNYSNTSYFIYVKKGIYYENVIIPPEKTNIILFGDGMNKTIITYNKSSSAGIGTQDTSTMDITTEHFLARDISIVNSAGPQGGPAVALRFAGDNLCCYRCSIEGYQDTLFLAYGNRHFFYQCNIYGTIDFIFGDTTMVLQNSFIYARRPLLEDQYNVITADGRESQTSNTAIVIHNCSITADRGFRQNKSTIKTYLGRPWTKYSRTIIMESFLDDLIDREGWCERSESFALSTLFYAEYKNYGPGASTKYRIKWPGYHVLNNPDEVKNFTVQNFINGTEWLPQLRVPFIPGLIG